MRRRKRNLKVFIISMIFLAIGYVLITSGMKNRLAGGFLSNMGLVYGGYFLLIIGFIILIVMFKGWLQDNLGVSF